MKLLTRLLSVLVGFAFTLGGFGKAVAQEAKLTKDGTVVMAKEERTPSMSSVDALKKQVTVLAATKDGKTKGTQPTKTKPKSPTKPKK
jgi:hypothetical protein